MTLFTLIGFLGGIGTQEILALIFIFGLLLVGGFIYFLPAILGRKKRNSTSILILNLLAGWTFVGWIVALVWAVAKDDFSSTSVPVERRGADDKLDKLVKLKTLLDGKAITEEEYDREKGKILE